MSGNPCGYFPGSLSNGDDITGKWEDDAGFPYRTGDEPFVYVAIYTDRDCTVKGGDSGRIMWNQEVVGS